MPQTKANPQAWGLPDTYEEALSKRHPHAKHFRLKGTHNYRAVFMQNVHYRDSNGELQEVDLAFRKVGTDHVMDRHVLSVRVTATGVAARDKATNKGIRWITPGGKPAVTGRKAQYNDSGLSWEYVTVKSGLKLQALVMVPRGARTYSHRYALVGGAQALAEDSSGNLVSESGFTVKRAFAIGATGTVYPCGAMRLGAGNTVEYDWDDSVVVSADYPYVLDPSTTFSVAASGDDGYAGKSGTTYPPTTTDTVNDSATVAAIWRDLNGSTFTIYNGLFRWDTSSVTGTVTGATLRAVVQNKEAADSKLFTLGWYAGSNWPIDITDYTATAETDAHAGTAYSGFALNSTQDFVLTNVGNVNIAGYTGLRGHLDGGQPTGRNYLNLYSYDDTTYTEPQLLVDYTEAATRRKGNHFFGLVG